MRLFLLHRQGRVLGPSWDGWLVKPDCLVDPDGNETSRALLHNYFYVIQFARQLAGECGRKTHGEFYKLLSDHTRKGGTGRSPSTVLNLSANERGGLIQGKQRVRRSRPEPSTVSGNLNGAHAAGAPVNLRARSEL